MKLYVELDVDNAAFEDEAEYFRVLNSVAIDMVRGKDGAKVRDSNGNTVGRWWTT